MKGNRNSEAYRQSHLRDDGESPGRNESERIGGLESEKLRRSSLQPEGEGSMGSGRLVLTADPLRRGGSDSMVTRTRQATGETLLVPGRNHWRKVSPITSNTGKWVEGEREADGSEVAMNRGNAWGAKGPCCWQFLQQNGRQGRDDKGVH